MSIKANTLLILCSLLLFTGACKKEKNRSELTGEDPEKEASITYWEQKVQDIKPDKNLRIIYAPKSKADSAEDSFYWNRGWNSVKEEAAELGIRISMLPVKYKSSDMDRLRVEEQITLINTVIEQKSADGIIIGVQHTDLLAPVISRAKEAGIKVIAIDTKVNSSDIACYIEFDNYTAGKRLAYWVASKIPGGKALVLTGPQTQSNAISRMQGYIDGLEENNITIVDTLDAGWGRIPIADFFPEYGEKLGDIDAVMCPNDHVAGFVIAPAAAEKGLQGKLVITGFDGIPQIINMIKKNAVNATIDQPIDSISRFALRLLVYHITTGENLPEVIQYPYSNIISDENINDYLKPDL